MPASAIHRLYRKWCTGYPSAQHSACRAVSCSSWLAQYGPLTLPAIAPSLPGNPSPRNIKRNTGKRKHPKFRISKSTPTEIPQIPHQQVHLPNGKVENRPRPKRYPKCALIRTLGQQRNREIRQQGRQGRGTSSSDAQSKPAPQAASIARTPRSGKHLTA